MPGPRLLSLTVGIVAALLASHVAWGQPAAGAEWRTPAGTVQGTRFRSLARITTGNVNRLVENFKCEPDNRIPAGHEGQPLVVNGIMYVVTPFPNFLYALDATNGDVIF